MITLEGHIALNVVLTVIAVILIDDGTQPKFLFKLSSNMGINDHYVCSIPKQSDKKLMWCLSLIV